LGNILAIRPISIPPLGLVEYSGGKQSRLPLSWKTPTFRGPRRCGLGSLGRFQYPVSDNPKFPRVGKLSALKARGRAANWNTPARDRLTATPLHFTVYALDTMLSLPEAANKPTVLSALKNHILDKAILVGRFSPFSKS